MNCQRQEIFNNSFSSVLHFTFAYILPMYHNALNYLVPPIIVGFGPNSLTRVLRYSNTHRKFKNIEIYHVVFQSSQYKCPETCLLPNPDI